MKEVASRAEEGGRKEGRNDYEGDGNGRRAKGRSVKGRRAKGMRKNEKGRKELGRPLGRRDGEPWHKERRAEGRNA